MSEELATWSLDVQRLPDRTVLLVRGDLDLETAPHLVAGADPFLGPDASGGLVVDLSRLTFIDSSGLSVLIRIFQRMSASGRPLEIISPAPSVAKAFEITGLDQVLPLRRA